MKSPRSYLREPQIQYLSQLLDEIQNGELFVPQFQMFWNKKKRLELLQSIEENMPIGSLLVWRTQHRLPIFVQLDGHTLPSIPEQAQQTAYTYLLDGQQRLLTLFAALEQPVNSTKTCSYFYDLGKEEFILSDRKKPKPTWMPVNILLDSLALLKFQRTLKDNELIQKTERLSYTFRNYKIAIIPIATNDLGYAKTVFQRINGKGTLMI